MRCCRSNWPEILVFCFVSEISIYTLRPLIPPPSQLTSRLQASQQPAFGAHRQWGSLSDPLQPPPCCRPSSNVLLRNPRGLHCCCCYYSPSSFFLTSFLSFHLSSSSSSSAPPLPHLVTANTLQYSLIWSYRVEMMNGENKTVYHWLVGQLTIGCKVSSP